MFLRGTRHPGAEILRCLLGHTDVDGDACREGIIQSNGWDRRLTVHIARKENLSR